VSTLEGALEISVAFDFARAPGFHRAGALTVASPAGSADKGASK